MSHTYKDIIDEPYGCKWCEFNSDPCIDGSMFECRTTMSSHLTCMSFEYNGKVWDGKL